MSYQAYLDAQIAKTSKMPPLLQPRLPRLIGKVAQLVDVRGLSVLCVGCRNHWELDLFRDLGAKPVGIDLAKLAPDVIVMDMHALTFTEPFDVVFSCHSLEHAYDVPKALGEWARVTKPGGVWVIEVPIRYQTTAVDRHDFGSLDGLREVLKPYVQSEMWATEKPGVARWIGRVLD